MKSLWETMREITFEGCQLVTNEMKCIICKNILINAHSGPCGCLYCFDCIEAHLSKEVQFCPGNTEQCQAKKLKVKEDIVVDRSTNIVISKLLVKCPMKNCEFKDELNRIENHLRICNMRRDKCPYFEIGCKESEIATEDLNDHILLELTNHSKLLLESMDILRNEVESLKRDVERLRVEKKLLADEIELLKVNGAVKEMVTEPWEQDNGGSLIEFNDDIEISFYNSFLGDVSENKQIYVNINNETTNQWKRNPNQPMKDKWSNGIADAQCEKTVHFTDKSTKSIETNIQNLQAQILKIESDLEKQNFGDFLWIVENWTQKLHQAKSANRLSFFSEAFYTHRYGYKLCLRIYPIGIGEGKDTHLSVFFHVMSGEFDDMLSWPCKFDITFQIPDQESGSFHVTQSTKYGNKPNSSSYRKPINHRNIGIGIPKFIGLEELNSNLNLRKNDKLFIRCTINMKL